jgi:hypothetical protein
MDKITSKALVSEFGVPTPRSQELRTNVEFSLDFPVVLKPADDGSSVDLRICHSMQEVMRARLEIGPRRERILAEEFITGRELTVGLIDGECLPIIEIRPRDGTYDYEAKYNRDDTQYILDPELPVGVAQAVRAFSRAAWHAVGCRDVARVDFMLDERGPWFLEINTMPGFTDHSLVPKAAHQAGRNFHGRTGNRTGPTRTGTRLRSPRCCLIFPLRAAHSVRCAPPRRCLSAARDLADEAPMNWSMTPFAWRSHRSPRPTPHAHPPSSCRRGFPQRPGAFVWAALPLRWQWPYRGSSTPPRTPPCKSPSA